MTDVLLQGTSRDRNSRSSSVGAVVTGRSNNRKVTVYNGDFLRDEDSSSPLAPKTSLSPISTPPPPISPSLSSSGSYYPVSIGDQSHPSSLDIPVTRFRSMTSPPEAIYFHHSKGRHSRDPSNTSFTSVSDDPTPFSNTQLDRMTFRPKSPSAFSWRSSTSSLADSSLYSLINQQSSEVSVLNGVKQQVLQTMKRTKELQTETMQIPKLKKDITELNQGRQRLMNELLDQKAVVLQLKQRVSLLHEQNQELVKLAHNDIKGSVSGPILAIRNTLITTLAQLKQMEEQVQTIPTLKNQVRELMEENTRLKEQEQELVLPVPELPEGVSGSQYQAVLNENDSLRDNNKHLVTEVSAINKQLKTVTDSCTGLQKRMESFQNSKNTVQSLQERIKRLESEKDSLHQQLIDSKVHSHSSIDLDIIHLNKKVASLKKANDQLQSKMEAMKLSTKQEKEHLVMKLFELELINTKSSKFEVEKKLLDVERLRISQTRSLSSSVSPSPQPSKFSEEDSEIRSLSPDSQLQLLKFKQLEIHSHETQTMLQAMMSERQEMENRINELQSQLEEVRQSKSEQQLEEAESKLVLAQTKIQSLERGIRSIREITPDDLDTSDEILKERLEEMHGELQRLSKVEREAANAEGRLEQSKYTNDKLRHDKNKLEKKSREGRHRLKSLASELSRSAELVRNYQKQCLDMEQQLERSTEELNKFKQDNSTLRAELQVQEFEMGSHGKAGSNGAAATTVEAGIVSELQEKYSQLVVDLSSLNTKHDGVTVRLEHKEKEVEELKSDVDMLDKKEKETSLKNNLLSEQVKSMEQELVGAEQNRTKMAELSNLLSEQTKKSNELDIQLKELQETHQKLLGELKTAHMNLEAISVKVKKLELEKKSLQQKVEILSEETPSLVKQSTESKVARDEAERKMKEIEKELNEKKTNMAELDEKRLRSEKKSKELESKLRLLQADLDLAESKLDKSLVASEEVKKKMMESKKESSRLACELKTKQEYIEDGRRELEREKERVLSTEMKLQQVQSSLDIEKEKTKELYKEMDHMRNVEISKLHSELSTTVSEMGQLTTDYSSRLARIRELESCYQTAESQKDVANQKLRMAEKDIAKIRDDLRKKDEEMKDMKAAQASIVTQSRTSSEEVKKLKDEVYQYQLQKKKNDKEMKTVKDESSLHKEQFKISQTRLSDAQKMLQTRETELRKAYDNIAIQTKEFETTKKRLNELETQCEMLSATRDNLLHRLDRMEKLEMEHDLLKHKVQETLGQSSQLRNDNKALLQLLEGVETERPTFEKEATKNLQEENIELHQQVSLLSQWNDKHQKTITTLEMQFEGLEDEKNRILKELKKMQSHEQENKLLKKELGEVELEVNRLRRQVHTELLQEEMKVKMAAQGQLLSVFDEHNKCLRAQVCDLNKQIKELGGHLTRDRPVSPPPMPEISADLQFTSLVDVTRKCTELEGLNTSLQEKVAFLEAELISAQEISPKIRRRSSALLAASSIPSVPSNDETFISVPEEMLLPCSVLADAYINKIPLPESLTENYLRTIGEGWFAVVAQKTVTAECLQGYVTTFGRLSQQLLKLIVNIRDMRGNSALHHTLANGNFPALSVLLDLKCCNSNCTNKAGYTPLMLAAAHNIQCGEHKSIMLKLLNKTDLNIKSKIELQTALMLAVSSGSSELVSMFLEAKADINAQDKDSSTALMFACEKGYEDIVKQLLGTPNCDITLKDNDSQTAYDIASSYSHNEICNYLKRHKKTRKK